MLFDELDVTHLINGMLESLLLVNVLRLERNCSHNIFINMREREKMKWLRDC